MKKHISITIESDRPDSGIPTLVLGASGVTIGGGLYAPLLKWSDLNEFIQMLHEAMRERHRYVKEDV